jgi:phosphocarrier protein HPr
MITRNLVIRNKYGLHARPAAKFVEEASKYDSQVLLSKDGVEVNGKSIMGVLVLAAEKGSKIQLCIKGKDEKEAVEVLAALLEGELDQIDG